MSRQVRCASGHGAARLAGGPRRCWVRPLGAVLLLAAAWGCAEPEPADTGILLRIQPSVEELAYLEEVGEPVEVVVRRRRAEGGVSFGPAEEVLRRDAREARWPLRLAVLPEEGREAMPVRIEAELRRGSGGGEPLAVARATLRYEPGRWREAWLMLEGQPDCPEAQTPWAGRCVPSERDPAELAVATEPFTKRCDPAACGSEEAPRWSRRLGVRGGWLRAMAFDALGNLYAAVAVRGTARAGGEPVEVPEGEEGLLVASWGPDGTLRWQRHWLTGGYVSPMALAVDEASGVYVAGNFSGTLRFEGSSYEAVGERAGFLMRLAPDGRLDSLRTFTPSEGALDLAALAVHPEGPEAGLTVAGYLDGVARLGDETLNTRGRGERAFVAHLQGGSVRWVWTFEGEVRTDWPTLARAPDGTLVVAGAFRGEAVTPVERASSSGAWDGYVVGLDSRGEPQWMRVLPGLGSEDRVSIERVAFGGGQFAAVGFVEGATNLLGTPVRSEEGYREAFVLGLAPDGGKRWAQPIGGSLGAIAVDVAIDETGRVVVAGAAGGSTTVGPVSLGRPASQNGAFLLVLGRDGAPLSGLTPRWERNPGDNVAGAVAVSPQGLLAAGVLVDIDFEADRFDLGIAVFGCGCR